MTRYNLRGSTPQQGGNMGGKGDPWPKMVTAAFLDILLEEKRLKNFKNDRLTTQGWVNAMEKFEIETCLKYSKSCLNDKLMEFKESYNKIQKSRNDDIDIDTSNGGTCLTTNPIFIAKLDELFGTVNRDRLNLFDIGGKHGKGPRNNVEDFPILPSPRPTGSSKRKRPSTIDESLAAISQKIVENMEDRVAKKAHPAPPPPPTQELYNADRVIERLKEDGIADGSLLGHQIFMMCMKDPKIEKYYLALQTTEGRMRFVNANLGSKASVL